MSRSLQSIVCGSNHQIQILVYTCNDLLNFLSWSLLLYPGGFELNIRQKNILQPQVFSTLIIEHSHGSHILFTKNKQQTNKKPMISNLADSCEGGCSPWGGRVWEGWGGQWESPSNHESNYCDSSNPFSPLPQGRNTMRCTGHASPNPQGCPCLQCFS